MTKNTLIHTGFGAESTIWDVAKGIDLSGRRAIVTGASSGIGIETARALAATGAEVMLAVRDTAAGEQTAADVRGTTGNQAVRVGRLNLADLDSVHAFVAAWDGPLHLLINNAGVMALPSRELTDRGWGTPVRDQPHRALRPDRRAARRARRRGAQRRRGTDRVAELARSSALANRVRRPPLQRTAL